MKYLIILFLLFFTVGNAQVVDRVNKFPQSIGGGVPTYVTSGTPTALLSNSLDVDLPDIINPNDILICQLMVSSQVVTISTPTGWTAIENSDASNYTGGLFWKRADGTEVGTVTFTHTGTATTTFQAQIHRFSGCANTGTPYEAYTLVAMDFEGFVNFPAMTSTGNDRLAVALIQNGDDRSITSDATNYTNIVSSKTNVGTDSWLLLYTYLQATSGNTPTDTVTWDQNERVSGFFMLLIP